jgi:xylan 1,4-beta-xylosidase
MTAPTTSAESVSDARLRLPNPLIPGFHPDPSVVQVGDDYYLATSTFEFLPGIPIHHSRDLVSWTLIGHVATRANQLQMHGVPTGGGVWAPTIRFRDGLFYVIVADAMGRGMLLFTATNPAGPWSDGLPLVGIDGIDPDLVWDENGTCYVTFSGLTPETGKHLGIQQVRCDLDAGKALEAPRDMWSGIGLMFPEAPHLYRIGAWWYLLIAEGGTERGHAVSIARGTSPVGPFDGCPANPLVSARSTSRPIQNTGHGDFVQAPDGSWHIVLLGMRVKGLTRSFSALGRETFATSVTWVDGWPVIDPVELTPELRAPTFQDGFTDRVLGGEWIGVRRLPMDVAKLSPDGLRLRGEGRSMNHSEPTFVGRRQRRLDARITATVSRPPVGGSAGDVGGLTIRYDEHHHYDLEIDTTNTSDSSHATVIARACLPTISTEHRAALPPGEITLFAEMTPPPPGYANEMPCDLIVLGFEHSDGKRTEIATFDGRFLSAETACSFTGRVAGLYCTTGELTFRNYAEQGLP